MWIEVDREIRRSIGGLIGPGVARLSLPSPLGEGGGSGIEARSPFDRLRVSGE
jgi:hypothetical protein